MPNIFLSYRREDPAGIAGRIYDRLRDHFGRDAGFYDVDSIPPGVDFQKHIESVLSQCDVFLAVIGPDWAGESDTGRRIDNPEDWVRIEIEAALKRVLPLIPVLIDHTRMPSEADLPPSLVPLVRRHAVRVDQGPDFHHHVDRLIRGIELLFQRAKDAAIPPQAALIPGSGRRPIPGRQPLPERPPSASDDTPRQQEPTVRSLFGGALPKRRWFYLAALLLLVVPVAILTVKLIGNREATSPQESQPPQPEAVPIASTTTRDGPKNFTPPQEPQPPQTMRVPIASTTTRDGPKNLPTPHESQPPQPVGPNAAARPEPAKPPLQKPQPPQPKKERTNSIGIKLVRIEPGSFLMGTTTERVGQLVRLFPDSKYDRFDYYEQPQHPVEITRPFFLGIHEVTQRHYKAVMDENPSHFKGSDDLPVEQVSWLDAVMFCNKLSEQEKRTPFYRFEGTQVTIAGGNGYRLPTEAEWEYACRAGSSLTLYPFGNVPGKLGDHAWYKDNSGSKTHPVGQKRPNAWGLYDMLGNVWEWCQDWYEAGYYRASPTADPPGPAGGSHRVCRGGSWDDNPAYCRPAHRGGRSGDGADLGFRVAAVQE